MPAPLLDIRKLSILRDRTTLLSSIDWRVERGEHWAILGPNGCGKTSLLKALTGYLTPSSGEIELLGEHYGQSDWRDLRLQVGLVTSALQASVPPDEPALETVISGKYAQLDLWMKITPADHRAGMRLLRFTGAGKLATRLWGQLSQGERQRILIARALMAKPKLLILDEPCSGLDPVAREQFLHFIDALARQPKAPTLVLVTHHVEEITPAFTHALLLKAGRVAASGARRTTLTSKNLSTIFGTPVLLGHRDHRLHLRLPAREHGASFTS
ncbi:ABC transporter ATP-binding protein [Rariglobus hedericola]|uniref:ABC transporter ATP-binding protein n=1 Tax=Rariglobus hedericola TaxID=2597822 RepID=A0A556QJQ6_9BACT|nr:ABC transporter ATP-binding protein [Rariglobus hedericola]TSJ76885.1 ABC transporter ATP-binding protein [Rariglobus hedericola]